MKIENTSVRLKKLMEDRNLKQVDILEKCKPFCEKFNVKISKSDLSQYVSGKVEPGSKKLTILGLALNVNEAWLMGYDVTMERNDNTNNKVNTNSSDIIDELNGVYLSFAREAQKSGIHPDDLKLAIETIRKLRGE